MTIWDDDMTVIVILDILLMMSSFWATRTRNYQTNRLDTVTLPYVPAAAAGQEMVTFTYNTVT
jgi:hypothetical protein